MECVDKGAEDGLVQYGWQNVIWGYKGFGRQVKKIPSVKLLTSAILPSTASNDKFLGNSFASCVSHDWEINMDLQEM